ncbi:hypothetical protein [Mesorhizobium sp. M0698]|uniref:hypothetical protein n=1 Tax=Mesorhizobium sp. M0698 TaxID=2956987 RepID=UPI0033399B82
MAKQACVADLTKLTECRMASSASFVTRHLKDDEVFLFLEKFKQAVADEYLRRELQKDHGHKARFFNPDDIKWKK